MKTQSVSQYCRVTQATHLIAVNSQCNSAIILDLTRAVISDPVPLYERNTAVCCCYASRARALYVAHAAPPCIRIHRNLFPTAMNAAKPHHEPIDALSGSALHDWSTPSSQIRAPHKTIKNNADTKEFRLSHQTSVCEEAMSELVLTPDEHYLIGGSNSGSVYIWNLLTGNLVLLPQLHSDCITMIVPRRCHASSLSTLLFTASRDASVHVVDGTQMILNGAALSCDSNSSPAQSGSMCMPMNPMRARQEAVLCTVQRAVKCVRGVLPFSLNPGLLLSWGDDGLVRILDITHFDNVVEIFTHAASQPILHALLDPVHERYIFLALENGEVRALDIYFQEFSCSETRWDNSEDICLIKNLNGKFSKMFWSQTTADKSDNNESTSQTIVISTQEGIVHFLEIDLPIHDDTGRAWKRSPTDPQKLNFKEPGFLNIPRAQNFFHSFPEVSQRTVKEHARVSAVLSSSVTLPFEVNCFTAIYESPFEMFPLKLHPVLRRFPERNLTDTDLVLPVEICSSFPQSVLDILGITMSRKARKRQNYEHQLNHMQEVSCKTVNPLSSETTTPAKCDLENTLNDGARKKSKRDDVAIDEVDGIQVLQVQAEVDALSKECQKLKRLKGKLANEIMLYHK